MKSPNIKLLLGQFALILLIVLGLGFGIFLYAKASNKTGIILITWTLLFIPIALWTRTNSKKAFLTATIFYGTTVIAKDIIIGGEYALTVLFHIFFVTAMHFGMNSKLKTEK